MYVTTSSCVCIVCVQCVYMYMFVCITKYVGIHVYTVLCAKRGEIDFARFGHFLSHTACYSHTRHQPKHNSNHSDSTSHDSHMMKLAEVTWFFWKRVGTGFPQYWESSSENLATLLCIMVVCLDPIKVSRASTPSAVMVICLDPIKVSRASTVSAVMVICLDPSAVHLLYLQSWAEWCFWRSSGQEQKMETEHSDSLVDIPRHIYHHRVR